MTDLATVAEPGDHTARPAAALHRHTLTSGRIEPVTTPADRRTIYVIESGEYSDYSVICAFEREEDAQAVVADGLGDSYTEMVLFVGGHRPTKRITEWRADAHISRSGSTNPPRVHAVEEWDSGELVPHPQEELTGRPKVHVQPYSGNTEWSIHATGPDRESTIKACQDRYSKILAEREGL